MLSKEKSNLYPNDNIFGDPDDLTKFRWSRTKIRGTRWESPKMAKIRPEARKRAADRPNGDLPENKRYPELPHDMGRIHLAPKIGGYMGVA